MSEPKPPYLDAKPMTADLVARLEATADGWPSRFTVDRAHIALLREAASALRSSGEADGFEAAWHKVCDALDYADPDWMMYGPEGADAASALIRKLATPASAWRSKPESEGWYWHFDGAVMWMRFVYPRPGHNYLAVEDPEHPVTGQRSFRMAEKMGGYWIGPLPYPTPPTSTGATP